MNFYPSDVRDLSDSDLKRLREEIEESGVLDCDWELADDSWEAQAYRRWDDIVAEQHRRNPTPPNSTLENIDRYVRNHITPRMADYYFNGNPLFRRPK